ncbi:hypothetical protein G4Y79_23910 [Phototrophicus methaneseepsis]|uniref:Uncharacterized protein n=1 Tax=Phototrophicus methaneseepsis TaxID=2710758 RepID=A0A7S8IEL2_9CHLR|nr:hypothetical protein [Phototrophicus methaneseepsis]QPC82692.1 hypothetical protein G4Y79_23910 [Phototrophicus methaneseepsis]
MANRIGLWRITLLAGLCMGLAVIFFMLPEPLAAQAPFATNTPQPATAVPTSPPSLFATNTAPADRQVIAPNTPMPTAVIPQSPQAPLENYALRLWLESDLIDLALEQIAALDADDVDTQRAVQLTMYELVDRFPNAPSNPADLEELLQAMLNAPIGTVDMRPLVHRYVEDALNSNGQVADFTVGSFTISALTANLDGRNGEDAVMQVRAYSGGDEPTTLYDEIVLATRTESGAFQVVPIDYELPAVPFGDSQSVMLQRASDVNRDGLDEVVIEVEDSGPGMRLYIVGVRNGVVMDLVAPGQQIRAGQIVDWPVDNPEIREPELSVIQVDTVSESPDWPCLSEIPVTWMYSNNFYRPSTEMNASMTNQDSLGCALLAAEPILANEPVDAINLLNAALEQYGVNVPGANRALMTLAMAYTLNGQLDEAISIAQSVEPIGETGSWIARQSRALLDAIAVPSNTALDICEALVVASEAPACDTDAVLAFYFTRVNLTTQEDLTAQLNAVSLPVVEAVPVAELGRPNRLVVQFAIEGTSWWGFSPDARSQTYSAELVPAPAGFEPLQPGVTTLEVPDAAYDALLVDDDPADVLNILDTLASNNPSIPATPAMIYLRALSYDLLASRADARVTYFNAWSNFPMMLWGQLASKHLELR